MSHTINNRVSHVDIGGSHIYFCTKNLFSVRIFTGLHLLKQSHIFFDGTISGRILLAGLFKGASVLFDFLRTQIGYISLSLLNQLHCTLIHLSKIVGCKEQSVLPIRAEPLNIRKDGLHKFRLFLCGVCIIKSHVELTAIFFRQTVVQQNTFGMPDMQIAIGLRRETGVNGVIHALCQILINRCLNKISGFCFAHFLVLLSMVNTFILAQLPMRRQVILPCPESESCKIPSLFPGTFRSFSRATETPPSAYVTVLPHTYPDRNVYNL